MNRYLLTLLLGMIPALAFAQLPHSGFEEWESPDGYEIPVGWNGSVIGTGKDSSAYAGNYAVSVWNWYTYALGFVVSGPAGEGSPFALDRGGIPIDFVPEKLTGFYKFNQGEAPDTAFGTVVAFFRRYDPVGNKVDTVSYVKHFLQPTAEWTPFEIALPRPTAGLSPDSVVIGFFSTDPTLDHRIQCSNANECAYLSIDEVALVSSSGVAYPIEDLFAPAQIVPNPVLDGVARLQFDGEAGKRYHLRIHDAFGRLASEREVSGSEVDLRELHLSSGAYFISIFDETAAPIAKGRFVVE